MSLDVYLELRGAQNQPGSGIFIREDGQQVEISRDEWDERFPDREPFMSGLERNSDEVYSANITHNLGKMADEAGIYRHMWRPGEVGIEKAGDLIEPLRIGLYTLKTDPGKFREYNPENGWGTYEGLVSFVAGYLEACKEYPDAKVTAWR